MSLLVCLSVSFVVSEHQQIKKNYVPPNDLDLFTLRGFLIVYIRSLSLAKYNAIWRRHKSWQSTQMPSDLPPSPVRCFIVCTPLGKVDHPSSGFVVECSFHFLEQLVVRQCLLPEQQDWTGSTSPKFLRKQQWCKGGGRCCESRDNWGTWKCVCSWEEV